MEKEVIAGKKAELILGGNLKISDDVKIERYSKSSAGPGAGKLSIAISFSGTMVKKSISDDDYEFELVPSENNFSILRNKEVFLEDVTVEPIIVHCPEQAFFDLLHGCECHCVYCASPFVREKKNLADDEIVEIVSKNRTKFKAISLTSGIVGSVEDTVRRMEECVGRLRKEFPDMPIGVEPYVEDEDQILRLKEAGATEIKLNMECATEELFKKACPELDYQNIFKMLAHCTEIFGKGRVMSNVIVGLGETEDDVSRIITLLCMIGVAPIIRCVKVSSIVKNNFKKTFGSPKITADELLRYAKLQKETMEMYGLHASDYKTMCFECGCCDLVPFRDV